MQREIFQLLDGAFMLWKVSWSAALLIFLHYYLLEECLRQGVVGQANITHCPGWGISGTISTEQTNGIRGDVP